MYIFRSISYKIFAPLIQKTLSIRGSARDVTVKFRAASTVQTGLQGDAKKTVRFPNGVLSGAAVKSALKRTITTTVKITSPFGSLLHSETLRKSNFHRSKGSSCSEKVTENRERGCNSKTNSSLVMYQKSISQKAGCITVLVISMEAINKLHVSRSQKNLIPIQPVERSSGE
jgi:hypothetical protein